MLKFGYGRATDHACEDIRNGRLTREQAKLLVKEHDLEDVSDYFLDDVAQYLDMTKEALLAVVGQYRNLNIWQRDATGRWSIPGHLQDGVAAEIATAGAR